MEKCTVVNACIDRSLKRRRKCIYPFCIECSLLICFGKIFCLLINSLLLVHYQFCKRAKYTVPSQIFTWTRLPHPSFAVKMNWPHNQFCLNLTVVDTIIWISPAINDKKVKKQVNRMILITWSDFEWCHLNCKTSCCSICNL